MVSDDVRLEITQERSESRDNIGFATVAIDNFRIATKLVKDLDGIKFRGHALDVTIESQKQCKRRREWNASKVNSNTSFPDKNKKIPSKEKDTELQEKEIESNNKEVSSTIQHKTHAEVQKDKRERDIKINENDTNKGYDISELDDWEEAERDLCIDPNWSDENKLKKAHDHL